MDKIDKVIEDLVIWMQDTVNSASAKGMVFGLSGGIDSAVIAGLAKIAFGDNCLGIIMPINSNPEDKAHAKLVAESLNLKTELVDLSATYNSLVQATGLDSGNKMAKANIKPRLRMTTLYYYGQHNNYLVSGSSNASEYFVGYFTKYGDSGSDLLPLVDFVKYEIIELARALNIPDVIINKKPSAGLWEDQTDEDEMGFGYDLLDRYIKTGQGPEEIIKKINRMNEVSDHKRKFATIFRRNP